MTGTFEAPGKDAVAELKLALRDYLLHHGIYTGDRAHDDRLARLAAALTATGGVK